MNTTREIGTAVTTRALVRITEGNGHHKGVTGIALGYNAQYDSIKVGFIDASGNYTGDYTTVAVQHVELVTEEPAQTTEPTETPANMTPVRPAMTARTNRVHRAAATTRARSATTRAQARITRNGAASLSTYGVAAGLGIKAARTVAGSLRKAAAKLHLVGQQHRVHAAGRMRTSTRYTPAQVLLMLTSYRPRLTAYKAAAARLAYTLAA